MVCKTGGLVAGINRCFASLAGRWVELERDCRGPAAGGRNQYLRCAANEPVGGISSCIPRLVSCFARPAGAGGRNQ